MWKFVHKGFKCGKSIKSSFIVICPDDASSQPPLTVKKNWNSGANQYHSSYGDSGGGNCNDGPDREWKQRFRMFDSDIWSHHNYCHFLQAVGWGSAVITGFQVTDLCHRSNRSFRCENKCCFLSLVNGVSELQLRWARINDLLSTYSNYTVSLLSQTLTNKVLTAKHILPTSVQSVQWSVSSVNSSPTASSSQSASESSKQSKSTEVSPETFVEDVAVNHLSGSASTADVQSVTSKSSATSSLSSWHHLVEENLAAVQCNGDAVQCARRGDFTTAVKLWSQSCSRSVHSPLSLFNLAVCYEQGIGVDKDVAMAIELYSKAADLGHAKSAFNLAVILMHKSDCTQQAMELLEKASDLGLKEAQRELGVLYTEHSRRDMVQAAKLFEKASAQMDAPATYFLGICYEHGWGVVQNEAKAASLYRKSGSLGHTDALYNLGMFFEHGMGGLPVDKYEAIRYYQAASSAGNTHAADRLNILKKQHPLLTAIVIDNKASVDLHYDSSPTVSGGRSWSSFSRLHSFSSSTDNESDRDDGSWCSTSDASQSDTSTSCGSKHTALSKHTKGPKVSPSSFYLNSSDDEHDVDEMHQDQLLSTRSLDSIDLLSKGSFGKASISHVSSFG